MTEIKTPTAPSIPDDFDLLEMLTRDQKAQSGVFLPSSYWRGYTNRTNREICLAGGIANFRSVPRLSKGFADVVVSDPFDLLDRDSRTHRLYRLLARIPLIRDKIFGTYRQAIDDHVQRWLRRDSDFLTLQLHDLLEKYDGLFESINTLIGSPQACLTWKGRTISHTYVEQLQRLEIFSEGIDIPSKQAVVEVGGGFGINTHLLLSIFNNIEKFLYIDIPPILYISTQYLKTIFNDEVYDYRKYLENPVDDLRSAPGKILCLPPWVLTRSSFEWDLGWNAASFQEMSREQVEFYSEWLYNNRMPGRSEIALMAYDSANKSMDPGDLKAIFDKRFGIDQRFPASHLMRSNNFLIARPKNDS